jgi:uncharacterized protein
MATLIINVTEKCNASCAYCHVVHRPYTLGAMTQEMLELIYVRIDEYLTGLSDESIDILWHGGEPLLMGADFFQTILELERNICNANQERIHHAIQTNLSLLTDDFIDVFKQLGIQSIGTSCDPVSQMRGLGKKSNSEKYNELFINALRLLEKNGIDWGLIYVVTKNSLSNPLDCFYYLTNLAMTGMINLNPVLIDDDKSKKIEITQKEYAHFLGEIFPYWWKHRQRFPNVQPFKGLFEAIVNEADCSGCMEFGVCDSMLDHIHINSDGEASLSGLTFNWGSPQFGNIRNKSLMEILFNEEMERFKNKIEKDRDEQCRGCRFLALCFPGIDRSCAKKTISLMHKSKWCESRVGFIENYFEPVTGIRYEPKVQ